MKYLFLSPYGAIDDWKFSEFQLQKILSSNNEIYLIGCQNILKKSCIAIKAHSNFYKNDYLKNKICKRCIKNQKDYGKKYKIFYLENYITKEDQLLVNSELLKINANNFVELLVLPPDLFEVTSAHRVANKMSPLAAETASIALDEVDNNFAKLFDAKVYR